MLDIQEAIALIEAGDPQGAADLLERISDEMPGYATARVLLARSYERLHAWQPALGAWRQAYQIVPNSLVVRRGLERTARKAASRSPIDRSRESAAEATQVAPIPEQPRAPAQTRGPEQVPPLEGAPPMEQAPPPEHVPHSEGAPPPQGAPPPERIPPPEQAPPSEQVSAPEKAPPAGKMPASEQAPEPQATPPFDRTPTEEAPADQAHPEEASADRASAGEARTDYSQTRPKPAEREDLHAAEHEPETSERAAAADHADLDRLISELESARIVPRPDLENIPPPDLEDDIEDVVSETLARIYASQGQFQEAAHVYDALAEQQPEKSDEFSSKASEMREKASEQE